MTATAVCATWVVELRAPHLIKPLKVVVENRVTVGRTIPGKSMRPDVDLGWSDAEDHPVALHHFALSAGEADLTITDLGSPSGTFLNGQRLLPYEPARIAHGDQLFLGRMRLEVQIVLAPGSGGGMHYQPGLKLYDQTPPGGDELVLIIESDPTLAQALEKLISQAGYQTRVIADTGSAIRAFSQKLPSAAILDLQSPDSSALEFCRYVRRNVFHSAMPVVVINDSDGTTSTAAALEAGADLVFDRPICASDLCEVVTGLVNYCENSSDGIRTKRLTNETPFNVFPPENPREGMVLIVDGFDDQPITLTGSKSVSFGRQAGTGSLSAGKHIDLTAFDALHQGVSRLHMFLYREPEGCYVEDCDSKNRTFVNGKPLIPYQREPVHNGDEIRLGHLRMHLYLFEGVSG